MKIDHDAAMLRRALAHYPTGVTVVTACGDNDRLLGITANSFTSVSLEPPLVSWSLRKRSQLFEKFRSSERFAVNVLAATQADLADRFARHAEDRFAGLQVRRGLGGRRAAGGLRCIFRVRHRGLPRGRRSWNIDRPSRALLCGGFAGVAASLLQRFLHEAYRQGDRGMNLIPRMLNHLA